MLMPEMLSGQLRNRKQQSEKCLNTKKTHPNPNTLNKLKPNQNYLGQWCLFSLPHTSSIK